MKHVIFFLLLVSFCFAQQSDTLFNDTLLLKKELPTGIKKTPKFVHDPWFSQDKFLHLYFSASICGLAYHLYSCRLGNDEDRGKIYSVSLTAIAGIGKELLDKRRKKFFSWKDLCWDGLGLAAGYLLFMH